MSVPQVFVALSTFGEYGPEPIEVLEKHGVNYTLNPTGRRLTSEEIIKYGAGSQAIIAGVEPYTPEVLVQLPTLKCISRCGVGIDNIDLNRAKELNIKILNTPDVVIQPVAELTLGMMLDLLRKITIHTHLLRAGRWEKKSGGNLQGKRVGIIGLGRIGKRVSQLLNAFGAQVMAVDPHADQQWAKNHQVQLVGLSELLKTADIVTLHVADATFKLTDTEFRVMKEGALILNLSRGENIDEQALYEHLQSGHLGGAGLDVFSKEPYTGPLRDLDNVVLTPHLATLTRESRVEMETQAVKNLLQGLQA